MKLTFDVLMELEKEQTKEKFYQNMGYIVYYLVIFFVYGFAFLVGIWRENLFMLCYFYFFAVALSVKIIPIYVVKEKGQQHNEFKKYTYVPVSMKLLFRVKLVLIAKMIAKSSFIAQIVALIGMGAAMAERKGAGESLFIPIQEIPYLLTPILIGTTVLLIHIVWMSVYCYNAMRE